MLQFKDSLKTPQKWFIEDFNDNRVTSIVARDRKDGLCKIIVVVIGQLVEDLVFIVGGVRHTSYWRCLDLVIRICQIFFIVCGAFCLRN